MNVRERFLTVMEGGAAAPPKWEFGYWGANYATWYREGLAKHRQPRPLREVGTTNSSLYIPCWNSLPPGRLSAGMAVLGGYPQGFFGTLAHLMGYEHLFYNYTDEPKLIHDIQKTFTDVWLAV